MDDYDKQANDFLEATNTTIKVIFFKYDYYFEGDKERRNIYKITIKRKGVGQFTFKFGTSFNDSRHNIEPCNYDILSCLTNSYPGSFENFCTDYGYDGAKRKAEKVYKKVVKEWQNVHRLFSDVIEQLQEIN